MFDDVSKIINMGRVRDKTKLLSVNQMSVMEAYKKVTGNLLKNFKRNLIHMKENTQRGVQQIMKCMCQKTSGKSVRGSPILDRNYTI